MQSHNIESGVQLFSRLSSQSPNSLDINPKLFPNGGPLCGESIEVSGSFSSELLVDFLIRAILPKPLGLDVGTIFISCSHQINLMKITTVLSNVCKSLGVKKRTESIENALKNLTIMQCFDSEQMEVTFRGLDRIIQDKSNVNVVVIDDLIAQYWTAAQKSFKLSMDFYAKSNLNIVQETLKNLNLLLIFSRNYPRGKNLGADYVISKNTRGKDEVTVMSSAQETLATVSFKFNSFITYL